MIADWILDNAEKLWRKLFDKTNMKFSSSSITTQAGEAQANAATKPTPTASSTTAAVSTTIAQPVIVSQNVAWSISATSSPAQPADKVIYRVKPFKDNENSTAYWQGFLKSFMDLTQSVQYIITGDRANIMMYAIVPTAISVYFENVFYASFGTSELLKDTTFVPPASQYWLSYGEKDTPMNDRDFMKEGKYLDPLKDIFGAYENVDPNTGKLTLSFTYTFKSEKDPRDAFFENLAWVFHKIFGKKEPAKEEKKDEKPEDALKCAIAIGVRYQTKDEPAQQGMKLTMKSLFGKFLYSGAVTVTPEKKSTKMTLSQVSNYFHIPTKEYFINSLDYSVYRKLPYPAALPTPENVEKNALTLIGKTDYRGQEVRFGVKDEDSFRHMYIVGKTGTGKSTFLSNIIKSHMYTNKGLCLIDPHGDLVETVMEHVPSRRTNDVILFDVGDTTNPIGFNLLQYNTEDEKNLIVSGVVATFKKLFGNSWGPRLEYVLRNVMLSVVEYPNATIMHIMRVLTDKNFREEVLENVHDPIVLKFWRHEFDKWSDNQRNEAIAPITNKVGQFLSSPIVRNVFWQPASKLNMRKVMDEGKILLVNLSKGKIGEDNTEMIGSFIVTKLQIDAMSRTDIPEKDRRPFYLHIDEFQNFATDSFAVILSEARKYRLALIVANQYTAQLNETIRDAIFGNVGSMVSFNVGFDDASVLAQQFKWLITANDLISLPRFRAYARLMIDGIMSDPFSMSTLPLGQPELSQEIKDKIRQQSRQRYAMEREKLEELIKIWANKSFSPVEKAMEKAQQAEAELMASGNGQPASGGSATSSNPSWTTSSSNWSTTTSSWTSTPRPAQASSSAWQVVNRNPSTTPSPGSTVTPTRTVAPQQTAPAGTATAGQPKQDAIDVRITPTVSNVGIPISTKTTFALDDLVIGDRYDGIIKLKYNYGLFVIVRGIDGLLHKNFIKVPDGISRKDVYNIGDKIRVRAHEFKEMNGEKKIVWSQE